MIKTTRKPEEEFIRESNAIEGVYDEQSFQEALEAWDYIKGKPILTIPEILHTHELLMRSQPIPSHSLGWWRSCRIFVGGREGLNWQYIPNAMEDWVQMMNLQFDYDKDAMEHHSKKLHVTYERIHPFIDGNGRTGRMFMNWWRLRNNLPLLIIKESEVEDYYSWFKD